MIETIRTHLQQSADVCAQMVAELAEQTAQAAEILIAAIREGRTIYICGNGGSAAQAQHVAGELLGRFLVDRPALPCIALTTDSSVLTAVANDYDFEQIFERQVEGLVKEGDVLLALSTSGASVNILKAASLARKRGAKVVGLTGRNGGKLTQLCDVTLSVPAEVSPLIQEAHLALLHALCGVVEQAIFARQEQPAQE